jgi:hypothetical protein
VVAAVLTPDGVPEPCLEDLEGVAYTTANSASPRAEHGHIHLAKQLEDADLPVGDDLAVGSRRRQNHRLKRPWVLLVMASVDTLHRCHSTVRALMNSCAPISGFDRPSRASQAICSSAR